MLEPRIPRPPPKAKDATYIGGVGDFDLWWRPLSEEYIRVVRVTDGQWDTFKMPMRSNPEIDSHLPPLDRKLRGYWNDLHLTFSEADLIQHYLQCFAPDLVERLT